jgi:hypothetical protein
MTHRSGSVGRTRPGQEKKLTIPPVYIKPRSTDRELSSKDKNSNNESLRALMFILVSIISGLYYAFTFILAIICEAVCYDKLTNQFNTIGTTAYIAVSIITAFWIPNQYFTYSDYFLHIMGFTAVILLLPFVRLVLIIN